MFQWFWVDILNLNMVIKTFCFFLRKPGFYKKCARMVPKSVENNIFDVIYLIIFDFGRGI